MRAIQERERRRDVGNSLDRGRVDVVVDVVNMPARDALAFQVLLLKAAPPLVISSNTVVLAVERGPANAIMTMIK